MISSKKYKILLIINSVIFNYLHLCNNFKITPCGNNSIRFQTSEVLSGCDIPVESESLEICIRAKDIKTVPYD